MDELPISVVIVARNADGTIEECLTAVQKSNPAEIIVVDGASSDNTVSIARRFTHGIYSDEGKGLTFARQLGMEKAKQEYVAFVDSDVVLADDALATMLAEFEASDYSAISASETALIKYSSYWQRAQYQHYQIHRLQNHISMLASLFRRDTLLKYGFYLSERGLDNRMDDIDLEIRLREDGYKFGRSSASFSHRYRSDLKTFVEYQFFLGQVCACYIRKYGPWHVGFWPPLTRLYWLCFFLITGKPNLIPYIVVDGFAETAGLIRGLVDLVFNEE